MAERLHSRGRRRVGPLTWMTGIGLFLVAVVGVAALVLAWVYPHYQPPDTRVDRLGRMVRVEGGLFRMGNDLSRGRAERPAHDVRVGAFWIDAHEVTNGQFADFVRQTRYTTTAERRRWSVLRDRQSGKQSEVPGADWCHPGGPHTTLDGRDSWPVVHVSWHDAQAYAEWAGKQLPTEAQWEYVARSGLRDADYPWGRALLVGGRYQANSLQGEFPQPVRVPDGFDYLAPVQSFPPSTFGLYDLSGNAWEWCGNYFQEDAYETEARVDPGGPGEGVSRALRGGCWATATDDVRGCTVWARWHRPPDYSSDQIGFRCVRPVRDDRY